MAKSYKVAVFAGTKVVADMAQQVKNATIEASIQIKTLKGGATSATATILAPGPVGSNRKMEDVEGWFVNGTAANPPVANGEPWEAEAGNKNTNWWDGITKTWSLGSSVEMPKTKVVDNLSTESSYEALSAKQGALLNERKIDKNNIGIPNGVAALGPNGKIKSDQMELSGLSYKGLWNAEINSPHLVNGTGTSGDFYIVSVGGEQELGQGVINFNSGSYALYANGIWEENTGTMGIAPADFSDYFGL